VDGETEAVRTGWLKGVKAIGMTAGASTPNNRIGQTIERVLQTRGLAVPS
jgi:4-hydroxy-3-methylbut-2-enyl diphosphate reductase IspH